MEAIVSTPTLLLPLRPEGIPHYLRIQPRWAPWAAVWQEERGKWKKIPRRAEAPAVGLSPQSLEGWTTFDAALASCLRHPRSVAGLGFLLTDIEDLVAIDLDHCSDEAGAPDDFASDILERARSEGGYIERSPSGRGFRIFLRAREADPDWTHHEVGLEVYRGSSARFVTVTGHALAQPIDGGVAERSDLLEYLKRRYRGARIAQSNVRVQAAPPLLDEREIPSLQELSDLGVSQHALSFLSEGPEGTDRSRALFASGVELCKHLAPPVCLSVLVHNEHAWTIALDHRNSEDAAIDYLWRQHVVKAQARLEGSGLSETDFDDLAEFEPEGGAGRRGHTMDPRVDPSTGELIDTTERDAVRGSDQDFARRFVAAASGRLRWTPGLDWMINLGSHWVRDELLQAARLAAAVCATSSLEMSAKLRKTACSASTASAVLRLARHASGVVTPTKAWDASPMLLNTPGEVIDLETGRAIDRADWLFTQVTAVAPAATPTPLWDRFLDEVFGGDAAMVEFVQRLFGYCLTGSVREQKLFFLYGAGANGKSVLLDVLRHVAGTYAHNLPSEALMRQSVEGHPTMLASLHGRRVAISSEIEESAHWNESRIKSLTGDQTLTARFMRQDFFTFAITHKHVIAGNFKPRLKGDDTAMARRLVLIPFEQRFEGARRDDRLLEKLMAEGSGILAWAIEGARKWAQSGLVLPPRVLRASQEYLAENDDLALWLAECCVAEKDATVRAGACYASFQMFKQRSGEVPPSQKAFSQRLVRRFDKARDSNGYYFVGLRLRTPTDDLSVERGEDP